MTVDERLEWIWQMMCLQHWARHHVRRVNNERDTNVQ